MRNDGAPWIEPEELAAMPSDPRPVSSLTSWGAMFADAVRRDDGPGASWALACMEYLDGEPPVTAETVLSEHTARAVAAHAERFRINLRGHPPAVHAAAAERHDGDVLRGMAAMGPSPELAKTVRIRRRNEYREHRPLNDWISEVTDHFNDPAWTEADPDILSHFAWEVFTDLIPYRDNAAWALATSDLLDQHYLPDLCGRVLPPDWVGVDHKRAMAMIDAGRVDESDADGATILSKAVMFDEWALARHALAHGADPNVEVARGFGPLNNALVFSKQPEVGVPLVLDAGVDPHGTFDSAKGHHVLAWRDRLVDAGPSTRLGLLLEQAAVADAQAAASNQPERGGNVAYLADRMRAKQDTATWRDAPPATWSAFRDAALVRITAEIREPGGLALLAAVTAAIDLDGPVQVTDSSSAHVATRTR